MKHLLSFVFCFSLVNQFVSGQCRMRPGLLTPIFEDHFPGSSLDVTNKWNINVGCVSNYTDTSTMITYGVEQTPGNVVVDNGILHLKVTKLNAPTVCNTLWTAGSISTKKWFPDAGPGGWNTTESSYMLFEASVKMPVVSFQSGLYWIQCIFRDGIETKAIVKK